MDELIMQYLPDVPRNRRAHTVWACVSCLCWDCKTTGDNSILYQLDSICLWN